MTSCTPSSKRSDYAEGVLRQALAVPVQDAEVGLRRGVALFGRPAHPFRRLGIVPLDALAVVIHPGEAGLRASIALLSKRPT